jgi:hypothetical protein
MKGSTYNGNKKPAPLWPRHVVLLNLLLLVLAIGWAVASQEDTLHHRAMAIPTAIAEIPPELLEHANTEVARTKQELGQINDDRPRDLPWQRFAAPFDLSDKRPRISVLLTGLGLQHQNTTQMLQTLPSQVSLGFSSYSRQLMDWLPYTLGQKREVLIDIPVEASVALGKSAKAGSVDDAGPFALSAGLNTPQNLARLDWLLGRADGAAGVTPSVGDSIWHPGQTMTALLGNLRDRGYLVTTGDKAVAAASLAAGVPTVLLSILYNEPIDESLLNAEFARLEAIAKTSGSASISMPAYPGLMRPLLAWTAKLNERGFALAPLTAIAQWKPLNPTKADDPKSAKQEKAHGH